MRFPARQLARDWREYKLLAVPGLFAPVLLTAAVVVATTLVPGYSHRYDTISELARPGVANPQILEAGFIAYGALMLPVGLALYRFLGRALKHQFLLSLITFYGIVLMFAGVFRDGSTWALPIGTSAGQLHDYLALASFGSALGILLLTALVVRNRPSWRPFAWYSVGSALAVGAFGLLFQLEHSWGLGGLYQRGFCGTMVLWVGLSSVRLLLTPRRRLLMDLRFQRSTVRLRGRRSIRAIDQLDVPSQR